MTPRTEDNQAKKLREEAIFDAACQVIREKGFHKARMADIAQAAGISYGLVYHYFKSKSDLYDTLIEEWWRGLDETTDRLLEQDLSVEERLAGIVGYFLDQYEERPDLVHLFITEFSRSTANLTPERLDRFKNMFSVTEDMISRGQSEGTVRADLRARYLSYFFLGSLEALLSTMVLEEQRIKSREQKERLAEAVLTMFFEGARPR